MRRTAAIFLLAFAGFAGVGSAQQQGADAPKPPTEPPATAPKAPTDKAPPGAPSEGTGWSGSQTGADPKPDAAPARPPLQGTAPGAPPAERKAPGQ